MNEDGAKNADHDQDRDDLCVLVLVDGFVQRSNETERAAFRYDANSSPSSAQEDEEEEEVITESRKKNDRGEEEEEEEARAKKKRGRFSDRRSSENGSAQSSSEDLGEDTCHDLDERAKEEQGKTRESQEQTKKSRWDNRNKRERARGEKRQPECTLRLEYWMRTEEMTLKKRAHIQELDVKYGYYGVEEHIERTVFKIGEEENENDDEVEVVLEPNMFPYECPPGVTHWTLWSRKEMNGREIQKWVENYLVENMPEIVEWNYDMNDNCSVDVPHYHVFLREEHANYDITKKSKPGEVSYCREKVLSGRREK